MSSNKTGDIIEDLNSLKPERQKNAIRKIISAMTIGRDVSKLFPNVVKCIITTDIELKKLVYLYIINYARVKPLETLLAVNALKRDSADFNGNPLTRALAVRTMGCLGVEEIMQFLCGSLKDALNDKDPYVRKTAVICVAKVYDINSSLAEEQYDFVDVLKVMLEEESNAMVLANCISALEEISCTKGKDILNMNWTKCKHFLSALHENNEWTQICLLEGISKYKPSKQDEISEIIERVLPCVSHSNSGVVLAVIKILVKLLDLVENPETIRTVCKKVTPSMVTLLSSEPEIQYVALKNMNILIQKRPIIFEKDIKIFFCSFTEPLYNKLEKLEILYKLVSMNNIDLVLNELREYASDVDIKFVRRSVRLIGQCAIKLEKAAQRCVETLVELVKTQVSFVIQEAIIGLRDIFRRYPNTFEGAMTIINENLRTLDDPEAKSALIWIIGEYSDRIEGAENQLQKFIGNLKEEPYVVQINILDSATKTFLKCQSEESYNILNQVFDFCTKECENPDVRERGFIYYRLMSIDPQLASKVIINEKPKISEDVSGYDEILLERLMDNMGTLATIYCKPPELFVKKTKEKFLGEENEGDYEDTAFNLKDEDIGGDNKEDKEEEENDKEDSDKNYENKNKEKKNKEKKNKENKNKDNKNENKNENQDNEVSTNNNNNNGMDLLDLGDIGSNTNDNTNNINNNNQNSNNNDLFGDLSSLNLGGNQMNNMNMNNINMGMNMNMNNMNNINNININNNINNMNFNNINNNSNNINTQGNSGGFPL